MSWQIAGISALVAVLLFLAGLACFALTTLAPPAAVPGIFFLIGAFALGLFAILPAVWAWQWNSREKMNA